MKFCALLMIVAAVCVMLPSDAEAGPEYRRQLEAPLEVAKRWHGNWNSVRQLEAPLEVAKRQLPLGLLIRLGGGRRQLDSEDSEDSEESIAAYLKSDELAALLVKYDLTMEEFDDAIDNDPEIEEEDRPKVKALALMILSAFDKSGAWLDDSSEEDK